MRGLSTEQGDVLKSVEKLTNEMVKMQQNQSKQLDVLRGMQGLPGQSVGLGHGGPRPMYPGGPTVGMGHGMPQVGSHNNAGPAPGFQTPRRVLTNQCRYCLENGHWVKDCPQRLRDMNRGGENGPNGSQKRPQGPTN